jgi:PA-IL-like protein
MESVFQTLSVFVISLSILLFFGPILVIIAIIGNVQLGPVHIDLSNRTTNARLLIALVGLGSWLAIFIPLVSLAFKAMETDQQLPSSTVPTTQTAPSRDFQIPATAEWYDTGIVVSQGDTVQISYMSGAWSYSPDDPNALTDGNGNPSRTGDTCIPVVGHNTGSLVGRIGSSDPFWIGNGVTLAQTNFTGSLKLSINDCAPFTDNIGSLTVRVTLTK